MNPNLLLADYALFDVPALLHEFLPLNRSKILVVDDSSENIRLVANMLFENGYKVLSALSGETGIKIAEKKLPDLILLDVMMPGINGFETCKKLKQNPLTRDIPVIFISANTQINFISEAFETGAVDYIVKPFNQTELLLRVKNHLKLKAAYEQLNTLFSSRFHSYITLNTNYELVNFNQTAQTCELFFSGKEFKVNESVFTYISEKDHDFFNETLSVVSKGEVKTIERVYYNHGISKWYNYIFEPIYNRQKELIGFLIDGMDITEKKKTELQATEYFEKINELHEKTQSSLTYASYIQSAILPDPWVLNNIFPDNFVLYRPKDKVSGDFYWTHSYDDKLLVVMGDCTGHGVPGAFLTAISIMLLEKIVISNKITDPSEILYQLDKSITYTLRQKDDKIKDGLEAGVCLFSKDKLIFCGAKRSVLIKRNSHVTEIKGNRFEIGSESSHAKEFKEHAYHLHKGDTIYLFTDGIVDQFGGPKNKKLSKKRLKELIETVQLDCMEDQEMYFLNYIEDWMKGQEFQTDDILIIGIKIGS